MKLINLPTMFYPEMLNSCLVAIPTMFQLWSCVLLCWLGGSVGGVDGSYVDKHYPRSTNVFDCCLKNNIPGHCLELCDGNTMRFYGMDICIGAYDNIRIYCVQMKFDQQKAVIEGSDKTEEGGRVDGSNTKGQVIEGGQRGSIIPNRGGIWGDYAEDGMTAFGNVRDFLDKPVRPMKPSDGNYPSSAVSISMMRDSTRDSMSGEEAGAGAEMVMGPRPKSPANSLHPYYRDTRGLLPALILTSSLILLWSPFAQLMT